MADQKPAYIVSSLKYRPQTFEDVVGQEHVSRTLRNALQRQRLANGYIFTGPRGVGKTTSARIMAKAINCENPKDGNPCNVCNHCIEITSGRSLDVQEVDGASTRGIDAIRELREVVKYPPANSHYRVYIIDEVHMLTKEAFNALLKTLEEPPPNVLFIFATTEPQKVPLTILSRCQRYDFRMISTETMVARLKMISAKEGILITDEGLALISRKAAGSLRDCLSLLDQVSAFAEDEASLELVRSVLGVLDASIYFELIHHVASQSGEKLINQANMLFSRGISISEFLHGLSEHLRNLLVVKIAGPSPFLDVSDTDSLLLVEQAAYLEERDLLRMQTIVLDTIRDQRFVSNQLVSVELMLLKIARNTKALDLDALFTGETAPVARVPELKTLTGADNTVGKGQEPPKPEAAPLDPGPAADMESEPELEETPVVRDTPVETSPEKAPVIPEIELESLPSPTPEAEIIVASEPEEAAIDVELSGEAAPKAGLQLEDIIKGWDALIEALGSLGRSTGAFMSEGSPNAFVNDSLSVVFAPEQKYHIQTLNKSIKEIQEIAAKVFGTKMTIQLLEQNGHKPKERKEDEIFAHPTSQHLLDIFDGEIIDS
ncbi:MAG: DNA polymerase III subunit gamma/tau [Candidatus Marinimicrobia bacterium]|nr:DNA polymerase III subunit gamma/tau [Candidatus Neomarinimicrobiota bacterium]